MSESNVDGATDVPPDVVIVGRTTFSEVPSDPELDVQIVDTDGNEVSAVVEWSPHVVRITPDAALAAGDYMLVSDGEALGLAERPFSVAESTDVPSIEAPDISARRRTERDLDWGPSRYIDVSFDDVLDAASYEIEVAATEDFTDAAVAVSMRGNVALGDPLCGRTIADYDHTTASFVRVRAVSYDGTTSEWSNVDFVAAGTVVGCSVVPSTPVGGLGILMLLGLAARRRR